MTDLKHVLEVEAGMPSFEPLPPADTKMMMVQDDWIGPDMFQLDCPPCNDSAQFPNSHGDHDHHSLISCLPLGLFNTKRADELAFPWVAHTCNPR